MSVSVSNFYGGVFISDVVRALDYVVQDHNRKVRRKVRGFKGSTVNLSIEGAKSVALNDASNAAVAAGLHVVGPLTVSAIDQNDARASFSNFGECVDIYAPGVDIELGGLISSPLKMSGKSMSTPPVTGLMAYFLSLQPGVGSEYDSLMKPEEMKRRFLKLATKGAIEGLPKGSKNLLALNGTDDPAAFWR